MWQQTSILVNKEEESDEEFNLQDNEAGDMPYEWDLVSMMIS